MPYSRTTYGATVSAAQLNNGEAGIESVTAQADALEITHVVVAAPTGIAATDTAAIQAALNSANAGIAVLRPGTYATNATLTVPSGKVLAGRGWGSIISYSGTGAAVQIGSNTLSVDDPDTGGGVRDLRINGTASGAQGIRVRGLTRWFIEDVRINDFTAGDGIKLHGASFIGRVTGGRIQNCLRGISAKKEAGFGDAGEGCAMNAVEVHGGLEIQGCTTAMEIGDPAVTETGAVVAIAVEIHGVTIENNTAGGIWNVGGNGVNIHDCYFEENVNFDIRVGSISGNTSTPVLCVIGANFINPDNNGIAIHVLRALHTRINPNYILGVPADTTSGVVLAAGAASTLTLPQFYNTIDTEYSDAGTGNLHHTMSAADVATLVSRGVVRSYANTSAEIQLGNNAGQAGIYFSNALDVLLTRSALIGDQLALGDGDSLTLGQATNAGGNFFQFFEQTADPAAAPANGARLFAKDDGAGNTQLAARFATGDVKPIVTQGTGVVTKTTSYTLALSDADSILEMNSASAQVFTIPPNSSVAFPIGTAVELVRLGAGSVTITPGSGVTIPNSIEAAGTSSRTITSQYTSASLYKRGTNEWVLSGSIT